MTIFQMISFSAVLLLIKMTDTENAIISKDLVLSSSGWSGELCYWTCALKTTKALFFNCKFDLTIQSCISILTCRFLGLSLTHELSESEVQHHRMAEISGRWPCSSSAQSAHRPVLLVEYLQGWRCLILSGQPVLMLCLKQQNKDFLTFKWHLLCFSPCPLLFFGCWASLRQTCFYHHYCLPSGIYTDR